MPSTAKYSTEKLDCGVSICIQTSLYQPHMHTLTHSLQYWQSREITKLLPHWTRSLCQVIINRGSCQARNPHMVCHIDVCCPLGLEGLATGMEHDWKRDWGTVISDQFNHLRQDVISGTSTSCHPIACRVSFCMRCFW